MLVSIPNLLLAFPCICVVSPMFHLKNHKNFLEKAKKFSSGPQVWIFPQFVSKSGIVRWLVANLQIHWNLEQTLETDNFHWKLWEFGLFK